MPNATRCVGAGMGLQETCCQGNVAERNKKFNADPPEESTYLFWLRIHVDSNKRILLIAF